MGRESAIKIILAVMAMAAVPACGPPPRGTDVEPVRSPLLRTGLLWQGDPVAGYDVPVCWELGSADANPENAASHANFAALSSWTRNTLETSWSAAAKIRFTGWADCLSNVDGDNPNRIAVHWASVDEPQNSSSVVGRRTSGWTRMRLQANHSETTFRRVVRHEFGHALGFDHEFKRIDNTDPSCDGPEVAGDTYGTPNDPPSIMNWSYCTAANGGNLSNWDIVGTQNAYGPKPDGMDFTWCAPDFGSCAVQGSRYMAYGANGTYVYKMSQKGAAVPCDPMYFGIDPLPDVPKSCYYANYAFQVGEYGSSFVPSTREIAYGADGKFFFRTLSGNYDCNNESFGDPIPGVVKACYAAVPEYTFAASEGGFMNGLNNTAIAYGANGRYVFKVVSGIATCGPPTFGADPRPFIGKSCYRLDTYAADEYQTVPVTSGRIYRYTSGLNGNVLTRTTVRQPFTCSNSFFGGDPDVGALKRCYGPTPPPPPTGTGGTGGGGGFGGSGGSGF